MRHTLLAGFVGAAVVLLPGFAAAQAPLPPAPGPSLSGGWTRNADLSDAPADGGQGRDGDQGRGNGGGGNGGGGGGGGRRRGGGGGGGGYGGGGSRGGAQGNGATPANPDEVARMRDAMRDVTNPSDHFIITQTPTIVVLTGIDGRTTRLAPDGKKVKDENTKVERKTKWDGGKLVSEINGLGSGKMTQTFAVDPEGKQLRITLVMEGGRSGQPRTITQVYDLDQK